MKTLKICLFISLFFASLGVKAWGPTGHRSVGKVAEKYLKASTLRKIKKLLDGESLASASNWPDKIKSDPNQYKHTFSWHYTSWPTGQEHYDPTTATGSLITAIENNIKVLSNKKKSKSERAFALKFITHLIGDLHQPLHIGNGEDRGGNFCKVYFHKVKTNLHQLWDEKIIEFTQLSFNELSQFAIDINSKNENLARKGNLIDWAQESKNLREIIYPNEVVINNDNLKNKKLNKDSTSLRYCLQDIEIPDEELPRLSYNYSYVFFPILKERIFKAGVRLAMILEKSL